MGKNQDIINSKTVSQEQLRELLNKDEELYFSFISSFYALKPWDKYDLLDVYYLLRDTNQSLHGIYSDSIAITASGGELNTRTLYVTPVVAILVSIFKPTFLQGNTAISGCGCGNFAEADIIKELGIKCMGHDDLNTIQKDNFAFIHALTFHPLLKKYHKIRASLGFRDIFKVASTLADPFLSSNLFLCVYSEEQLRNCADILNGTADIHKRTLKHAVIVTGEGIDEASLSGITTLADIPFKGTSHVSCLGHIDFGRNFEGIDSLYEIGSELILSNECKQIINILKNNEQGGKTQLCILNAGIALYAADIVKSIENGIELARHTIESGQAYKKYLSLINH
jgi:anthranilate phosphoribosyltransferase